MIQLTTAWQNSSVTAAEAKKGKNKSSDRCRIEMLYSKIEKSPEKILSRGVWAAPKCVLGDETVPGKFPRL